MLETYWKYIQTVSNVIFVQIQKQIPSNESVEKENTFFNKCFAQGSGIVKTEMNAVFAKNSIWMYVTLFVPNAVPFIVNIVKKKRKINKLFFLGFILYLWILWQMFCPTWTTLTVLFPKTCQNKSLDWLENKKTKGFYTHLEVIFVLF